MVPYNEKLSTVRVSELTCEWLGRFVPQPSLDDIRLGAETRRTIQTGYNRSFLYPAYGGIATLSAGLAQLVPNLVTQARATAINTRRRTVSTDDGRTFGYDKGVIATLPLPELASIVTPTDSCFDSRTDLRANVVTCVNVGLQAANPKFSQYQWVYLPERQFAAYRIGFYARFAASMAPKGREGLYVEIAHGPHQDEAEIVERALADLLALGVTDNLDSVDTVYPVRIGCAYVIHDSKTSSVRTALHDALVRRDIWVAGRYARWEYSAMEDAIVSGLQAARRALQATPSRGGPT
jgi:protoporphyrinogen oxidase